MNRYRGDILLSQKPYVWRFAPDHIEESPSREDGIPIDVERMLRFSSSVHIVDAARLYLNDVLQTQDQTLRNLQPKVSNECIMSVASGALYLFHRFYMRHSFAKKDRFIVACAALFLSLKVDERYPTLKRVLDHSWKSYYQNPLIMYFGTMKKLPDASSPEYRNITVQILEMERIMLYTLEFDVVTDLPNKIIHSIVRYWRDIGIFENPLVKPTWQKNMLENKAPRSIVRLVTGAKKLCFSSLYTTMCLEFSPLEIALAGLGVAAKYMTSQGLWDESMTPFGSDSQVNFNTRQEAAESASNPISSQLLVNTLVVFSPKMSPTTAKSHSLLLIDCINKIYSNVFGILEHVSTLYGGTHSANGDPHLLDPNNIGLLGMPQLAPID